MPARLLELLGPLLLPLLQLSLFLLPHLVLLLLLPRAMTMLMMQLLAAAAGRLPSCPGASNCRQQPAAVEPGEAFNGGQPSAELALGCQ